MLRTATNLEKLSEEERVQFQDILHSDSNHFAYLSAHSYVTMPDASEMPQDTPKEYESPSIKEVEVKGVKFTRIYVPAVAKKEAFISDYIFNNLRPFLIDLFGNTIVSMKMRESIEYENFNQAKESVILSVEDFKAQFKQK